MSTTELVQWLNTTEIQGADVKVPTNLIRVLLAQSVVDNWPRYEIAQTDNGDPVVLRFGSPSAANKALEMLAKDSGMLDDKMDVSGAIRVEIVGVNVEDLR
jgi:hypothetical protein